MINKFELIRETQMLAFLSPFFSKIGVYLIVGGVIIALGIGAYAIYENQKAQIATLTANVSTFQSAVNADQADIAHLKSDMAVVQKQYQDAQNAIQNATAQATKIQQQIRAQNLVKAAKANPVALQTQLNTSLNSTFQAWGDLTK